MLAADNWCVKVEDKVYGPYTSQQLRKFAHEGRLAAWSLIAPAGSRGWREAREESIFSTFFGEKSDVGGKTAGFGKRTDAKETSSQSADTNKNNGTNRSRRANQSTQKPTGQSNFVIIFDVVSAAATSAESAILSAGTGFRIASNVWAISSTLTATGILNSIVPYLQPTDPIMVVDSTNGKTVWRNFAPALHAKLTAAWIAPINTLQ